MREPFLLSDLPGHLYWSISAEMIVGEEERSKRENTHSQKSKEGFTASEIFICMLLQIINESLFKSPLQLLKWRYLSIRGIASSPLNTSLTSFSLSFHS